MSSKEEEKKALREIEAILNSLGTTEDSYVCKAMEGCIETAELNIQNDFFCSYKAARDSEAEKVKNLAAEIVLLNKDNDSLRLAYERMEAKYERELEWKPYQEKNVYSQENYEKLRKDCDDKELTVEQAKEIVCREGGFDSSLVRIVTTVPIYEINRHNALRQSGLVDRKPFYYASDYNCIVFECGGYVHELQDGTIWFNNRDFA